MESHLRQLAWSRKFAYGTVWQVGENLWGALLPETYVQRRDRTAHPGLCLATSPEAIHAVMPMMYGTHNWSRNCFPVCLSAVKGDGRMTYFGAFAPVCIGLDLFTKRKHYGKDHCANVKFEKNHVVMFEDKRILVPEEIASLKAYVKARFGKAEG